MSGGDLENGIVNDEEVGFLSSPKPVLGNNTSNEKPYGSLLTREDLLRLESEEPIWRRVRLILLIAFWVLWVGLLAAAIVIIVVTPKCPPTPVLSFWQKKVGYWLDPFSFSDSNGDFIGDFKGIVNKLDYIKDVVGAGFIILSSIVSGHYSNAATSLGLVRNFSTIDPALGTLNDFRSLIKTYHRSGLEVVITLDFNSISTTHEWVKKPEFLRAPLPGSVVARDGSKPTVNLNGKSYYSVGDKNSVDLNLSSDEVVQNLESVTKYWLNEGVDGILLSSAAFYVEEENEAEYPMLSLVRRFSNIFTIYLVDPGDCGYGLSDTVDKSIDFLGTKDHPAAHMVISRQFVEHRGWKAQPNVTSWQEITIRSYHPVTSNAKAALALTTATPSDHRHGDIAALASIFLLPGTPLVYYGSELAIQLIPSLSSPEDIYPFGKVPFPNLSKRDSELVCQLPMPWDRSGAGFSSSLSNNTFANYLKQFGIVETVDSALSFGRENTPLKMVQELIKLREKPSLKWGEFEMLESGEEVDDIELFKREAIGHPAFIVAVIKRTPNYAATFNFAGVCGRFIPRLTYPLRPALKLNEAIDSSRIYLQSDSEPAVYVFECA
ncbi:hypothetical protein T265_02864 [Opisthorchis viverrini]|uniref:Glycosyl hydrolase family 13 catalytic domain-containing protein n=1 Tax=Opisthorchis viverrini TaxID=6198 RepID=A0A074ZTN5_OPIVI|nr:hypothetical protein T265_02864 [Opisthorchis viverrini]KER30828.1 hypothetical protein T265_02864 [Opisthorchis viverrini]